MAQTVAHDFQLLPTFCPSSAATYTVNTQWWDRLVIRTAMLVAFFRFLCSAELLTLRPTDIQISQSRLPYLFTPVLSQSMILRLTLSARAAWYASLRAATVFSALLKPYTHSSPTTSHPTVSLWFFPLGLPSLATHSTRQSNS